MMHINATQLIGLLSFGVAAVFCYSAWRATRSGSLLWGWITLIYLFMAADTVLGSRYLISNAVRAGFKSTEIYHTRRIWQVGIVICLLILIGVLFRAGCRHPQKTIQVALLSLLAPIFFVLEATSLHSIDAVLYHAAGPILLIGWIWIALAALTALQANHARISGLQNNL